MTFRIEDGEAFLRGQMEYWRKVDESEVIFSSSYCFCELVEITINLRYILAQRTLLLKEIASRVF